MKNNIIAATIQRLEREEFDSYDPTVKNYDPTVNNFDTQNSGGGVQASPGAGSSTVAPTGAAVQSVQFNVVITSTLATPLNIELFQNQSSQTKFAQSDVNNYVPLGLETTPAPIATGGAQANTFLYGQIQGQITSYVNGSSPNLPTTTPNVVGFDNQGNLVYQPGFASGSQVSGNVTISCLQVPYRLLFDFSGLNPFRIAQSRLTYTGNDFNQSQIDQTINQITKTWLGAKTTNNVSPRSYFNPNQFQSNIIDVPVSFKIVPEIGIQYNILANQVVNWNMFIQRYVKNDI